jgi:poly-gamma-glutamate synthesis protein (capsule biosynthesis protein)
MTTSLTLLGDINFLGVSDPTRPFAQVGDRMRSADVLFANLECCFFDNKSERSVNAEGFFANPAHCSALVDGGVHVIGNGNNVNFGAPAIRSSIECLESHGIAFTGAGRNTSEAHRPVIVERNGVRFGFMQRTSVYWTHGHEVEENTAGVAILPAHTAYRPRLEDTKTLTRPGNPPEVLTWADPARLERHCEEVAALRKECDILVASQHWGLGPDVLSYQREIAHAVIDAGADLVFGHGPHYTLPIECYRGKTIIYGAGSFSFETGHQARKHPDWLGIMVETVVEEKQITDVYVQFVRHNADNETILRSADQEASFLSELSEKSAALNATLQADGERVRVTAT